MIYRVFSANAGVEPGALVVDYHLKGPDVTIQAIVVGESGRGRSLGILPVAGIAADEYLKLATLTETQSGRPKLIAALEGQPSTDACIAVFETKYGFRGSNSHEGLDDLKVLAKGVCADGIAGNMADGDQYIVVLPKNTVVRTEYSGRLYGEPDHHNFMFDGERLICATDEERELTSLF
ncbi:MAG: hypothetical protein OXL96_13785 [Candidatus Poribacteria bacterium]|nr:hypothetical protein [Candidatus Poribacteria bacterium]